MKLTDRARETLRIRRLLRKCERECKVTDGWKRYCENPMFSYCEKHQIWRLAL
jgi:hypothetical protein